MQMYREIIKALQEAGKDDSTIAVITGTILNMPFLDLFYAKVHYWHELFILHLDLDRIA